MCRALKYMNWRYHATYRLILHYLWDLTFCKMAYQQGRSFSLDWYLAHVTQAHVISCLWQLYCHSKGASSLTLSEASFSALEGQRARTQVCPTNKNCTPCTQCLGNTQDSASEKCNGGRIRGALPSWSQWLQCTVSMKTLCSMHAFISWQSR